MNLPKPKPQLPVLLFQARISRKPDKYGMFWTEGQKGEAVTARCPEGGPLPIDRVMEFLWESTGRAAACKLKEAIARAKEYVVSEHREYRLVSINYVAEKGLRYLVEWVSG